MLVPRPWDVKSKFLKQAGFELSQPRRPEDAIRRMIDLYDAVEDGNNDYGTFYRVVGDLTGPNGLALPVVLIWLQWKLDGTFHFVTLKPYKEES